MKQEYSVLFEPVRIGSCEIKNRFLMCPMEGTNILECQTKYEFNENCVGMYSDRAKNGVGLFVCGMIPIKSYFGGKWLYQQEKLFRGPVKELMDEIHSHGSKFFMQIGAGMGRSFTPVPMVHKMYFAPKLSKSFMKLVGFDADNFFKAPTSGMPNVWDPEIKTVEMGRKEIYDIIEGYGKAAKLARECGVDGIEVHAVHEGYLLDQFSWALTNKRTDEFGGSVENRIRFATEIIKSIKKHAGEDYPVSVRYSVVSKIKGFNDPALPGEEFTEAGRDYEESIRVARLLEEAGADLLNADNGSYDSWFWAHPPMYMPLACNLDDCAFIKQHVSIPVACAGRMEDPDTSSAAIHDGRIDIVALGRQFLCDGEYVTKLRDGRMEDLRPCIACHNGCFPVYRYKGLAADISGGHPSGHCALNPLTSREKTHRLIPAENQKHVAVVGGGIVGMEAARVCALRGHKVDLYEKTDRLGGIFIAAAAPAFKEKEKELITWYERQMRILNIAVYLNSDVKALSDVPADEYFIATGSSPKRIPVPGINGKQVMEATEYLLGKKEAGEKIAVIGGAITGIEIAYDLALKGKKPFVVETLDDILKVDGMSAANSNFLRAALKYYQVPVYTETGLSEVGDGCVLLKDKNGTRSVSADSVIMAIGYNSKADLADENDPHVHVIGDAHEVGNLMTGIWRAYEIAMKV